MSALWFDDAAEAHGDVRRLEHELSDARRRRAAEVARLIRGGHTEREIAAPLGVASSHIHQWKRQAKELAIDQGRDDDRG